jgi:hypothetical protein
MVLRWVSQVPGTLQKRRGGEVYGKYDEEQRQEPDVFDGLLERFAFNAEQVDIGEAKI